MNRHVERIIIYLIIVLISMDCGRKKIEYPSPSKKAINGSFVSNSSSFKLGKKEYRADYGTITVPENRSNNNSRLIHLPVIRIHASNKNPNEPIFGFAGGPGQTNMNWTPIDSLLFNHDFVMVGYRGVDGSAVLDCPEVAEAMINCNDDLFSESSLKNISKGWELSLNRLKSSGIDLDGYTIQETVEDMETVRKLFKYERINILSESYGTRIAYTYELTHPSKIFRTVMIGVNAPGNFIWDPVITDKLIKYYSGLWIKDSVKSKLSNNLASTMRKVLNNMPRKWLFFSINPGKVKAATFGMLMHRNTSAIVFDSFVAAEKGDYSGLALMSLAFDYTFPKMVVFGDCFTKAISADFDYLNTIHDEKADTSEILGSPFNDFTWKPLMYGDFQIKPLPDELRSRKKTDVETLMLSGSVDFANPPECAKEFLPYFSNGKQIILSEFGHVGDLRYLRQKMTDKIITNYFNQGIIEDTDVEYVPMDFNVSWGFPLIAKIAIGLIIIFGIAVIALIIKIIKITKSRRLKSSLFVNKTT